jgi:hypothetical protein
MNGNRDIVFKRCGCTRETPAGNSPGTARA